MIMARLTTAQHVQIAKTQYIKGNSNVFTFRALKGDYGTCNRKILKRFSRAVDSSIHSYKFRTESFRKFLFKLYALNISQHFFFAKLVALSVITMPKISAIIILDYNVFIAEKNVTISDHKLTILELQITI